MKRLDRKSDCAINYALEMIGDPWSMLIIRDIVYFGKRTFGDFLASAEHIATSALARRLLDLEAKGILQKTTAAHDRRREIYSLTEKGIDLIPVMLELAEWGAKYDPRTGASAEWIDKVRSDKSAAVRVLSESVRTGNALFPVTRQQ